MRRASTFRGNLLAGVLALVAAMLVTTVGAVALLLDRSARRDVAEALRGGQRVFDDLQSYRESLFRAEAGLMAEEPRLKAVVATQDVTRETVLGVAQDLRRAVGSDLFLLTDAGGRLVADVADPTASGFDLADNPVVAEALRDGAGAGLWTHDRHAYQVQARRVAFGTTPVGVVVLGWELDDRVAEAVRRQTGDAVAIALDGAPIAASALGDDGARADVGLAGGAGGDARRRRSDHRGHVRRLALAGGGGAIS
jgi:sigma-B regulation protein RsbU (phosphoserine phosphatase)